ncbi:hypothetical protein Hanom_Chr14g01264831 [Helianthus anomalus]
MPRNTYLTLQCAYADFRKNNETISSNELIPYEIMTKPTKMNFIRTTYTYEYGFAKISCFRTTQNANVSEKTRPQERTDNKTEHHTRVLT